MLLSTASRESIDRIIKVLMGTVGAKSNVTCRQLMMVLFCLANDGMTPKQLAQACDCHESSVSNCYNGKSGLGPDGSGCLVKDSGGKIYAHAHVIEAFNAIHST